ncbi:MAG: co-chaperone DjlA [Candidatus Contendobacter odensis]|uniref:Co-chaperone DjlA n=1 Tax=Candidatus Contendibacter odensensis TaxID=1400860 RepID=A0A2G6PGC0_9GAMM|nr:MAG: co-chaperone DjlA [Candidatus Contendobacter odensis]
MLGKLFGSVFGFMVGGPVGAFLGAAAGHSFDRNAYKRSEATGTRYSARANDIFINVAFQTMGYLAKLDGRVSEQEVAVTRAIMNHLRLNAEQRQAAIAYFTQGKQPDFVVGAAIDRLQQSHEHYQIPLTQFLELQLNIAYADGRLHPKVYAQLLYVARRLGIGRLQFEALHTLFRARIHPQDGFYDSDSNQEQANASQPVRAINSLDQAYKTLGLHRNANIDNIKLAYRRLIRQHHPDKLEANGISSVDLEKANDKTMAITAAYELIKISKGF